MRSSCAGYQRAAMDGDNPGQRSDHLKFDIHAHVFRKQELRVQYRRSRSW